MAQSVAGATNSANTSAGAGMAISKNLGVGVDIDIVDMKHCFENLIVIDAGANLTNKNIAVIWNHSALKQIAQRLTYVDKNDCSFSCINMCRNIYMQINIYTPIDIHICPI
ncbi:unnamed protein product [Ceratitis capitata]|uniref:(Mediterranean fruit fly) hypothetical protein n=1 Tax=Ceratitis capitata TaxID=7213 RepID=A0A811U9L0_CERCA|nr:unnamed protein product [Ceratitis capitata]